MRRRGFCLCLQLAILVLSAAALLLSFGRYISFSVVEYGLIFADDYLDQTTLKSWTVGEGSASIWQENGTLPLEDDTTSERGKSRFLKAAPKYIKAIMDPKDTTFPRLSCPNSKLKRYSYLERMTARLPSDDASTKAGVKPKYFFALDLHDAAPILPRLLGTIVETMRYLGPEICALSIVEGRSVDGTFEILKSLHDEIEGLGAAYFFQSTSLNSETDARIEVLGALRNAALEPLRLYPEDYHEDTIVVFLNDVAVCMDDILELIHQRMHQGADMVCAMDWTYVGKNPTFYDVWVARGMNGDSFFNIPPDGNWNNAWNLFWNDKETKATLAKHLPFQVFSCWNGATVFTAKPIMERKVGFRGPKEGECYMGEPQLFCKDMWREGFGKIAVVPMVNLEYVDEKAKELKDLKGYVSKWATDEDMKEGLRIGWEENPPKEVKCMPGDYRDQTWVPWNQGLD